MSDSPLDVLVLGAGMSGLACLRGLTAAGLRARAVDKGRGVGGRMATRRAGPADTPSRFDHGAQFFTARGAEFAALVGEWERAGVVRRWCEAIPSAGAGSRAPEAQSADRASRAPEAQSADRAPRAPEAHWIGADGMASVAKHMAAGLDVAVGAKVVALAVEGGTWRATLDGGGELAARAVVATAPVPQTLALLDAGDVDLPAAVRETLEGVWYHPCIAVMVRTSAPSRLPSPGALRGDGEPLAWIADNRAKGVSRAVKAGAELTLHAGPDFSEEHFDEPESVVVAQMIDAAAEWIGGDVLDAQMHRWRYSLPGGTWAAPTLVAEGAPAPIAFAGDAFGGPRVEGAWTSGTAAAARIVQRLR